MWKLRLAGEGLRLSLASFHPTQADAPPSTQLSLPPRPLLDLTLCVTLTAVGARRYILAYSIFRSRSRVCRSNARSCRRSAITSRVKNPCLSAFLLPRGAPDPGAPPCMRQRFLPLTAGDRQGLPERVLAPQRWLESIGPVLRG